MSYFNPGIKFLQRGLIVMNGVASNTATLSQTVDVNKTELTQLGITSDQTDWDRASAIITLTNGTTVTANKYNATGLSTVAYQVVEKYH